MDSFIKEIQAALARFGYHPGPLDGIWGPLSKAAIVAFQHDHGLEPDGLVGPLTQGILLNETKSQSQGCHDQLTPHFKREEFRCCCGGLYCKGFPAEMDRTLLERLEATRLALASEIIITSGVRCIRRNAEVGGIPQSKHLGGYAADCYAPGFRVEILADKAQQNGLGVLIYKNQGFCHLEV